MSQFSLWVIDYYCLPLAKSTLDVGHTGMRKTERYGEYGQTDSVLEFNSLIQSESS